MGWNANHRLSSNHSATAVRPKQVSPQSQRDARGRWTSLNAAWWPCLILWILCADARPRAPELEACLLAGKIKSPRAAELCERAWKDTGSEAAAAYGATQALVSKDDDALLRWARRARPTLEGARILHYWGQRQLERGDLEGAEATLRWALQLRIDRDPPRATNTAFLLLKLVRSTRPAEESVKLARLAWEQAEKGHGPVSRAFAASALAELLIDLGELDAADAVIRRMEQRDSPALKNIAEGSLRAAQGRTALAVALFRRTYRKDPSDPGGARPLRDRIYLVEALLDLDRIPEARAALEGAFESAREDGAEAAEGECRLAAVEAEVLLAEGRIPEALAAVARGLAIGTRDSARVLLLNVRGDALARRGDRAEAEATWRAAADSVEEWRTSLPSTQLRSGLVAHHRHALEAWLESTAARNDISGALEVTRRIIGRGLLDRIRQREAGGASASDPPPLVRPATVSANAAISIENVIRRLAVKRELAATIAATPELINAPHDVVAIVSGARSTWAIRRVRGRWSIDRVGDRPTIVALVDAYRNAIDDRTIAGKLGAAMFPPGTIPRDGSPLVVMLDRELTDVPLAGLRVDNAYLVELAPILEVLAPELLFAPLRERAWGPPVVVGDAGGDLDSAAREAAAVARSLGVEPQLGTQATRQALASGASARVVHTATHATLGNGEAALVLSDGTLSSLDIVEHKIAPRLAVIATCRSHVDDDPATSLVAALLAAGTQGVVGVKRALDDADGAELMLAFYQADGTNHPVRALAAAQRAAIANHRPPHAWATASFFGVGGWISNQGSER